jgi:hypothetical protein
MNTMSATSAISPILYADLQPGSHMGTHTDVYDQAMSDRWRSIFAGEPSSAAEQASMSLVLAMRALLSIVAPRPPGNVHGRQKMTSHALPRLGENVRSEVMCLRKEIKRERMYVDFAVKGRGEDERILYEAQMSLIWAA